MQATQLELPLKGRHGGARPKAGRKRVSERKRTFVAHRSREGVKRYEPLLLTLKLVRGLPTLRGEPLGRAVMDALEAGARIEGFRLVEYSVQSNHIHAIAEAEDADALARGMKGLARRVACAINRVLGRRGKVFVGRFHGRSLGSPYEVRNALAYVLHNCLKHGTWYPRGYDPYSSAPAFGAGTIRRSRSAGSRRPRRGS